MEELYHECPCKEPTNVNASSNNMPSDNSLLEIAISNDEYAKIEQLSTERSSSSIPKSSTENLQKWEYPSEKMFYGALKRKGFVTLPEDISTMVLIHNYMNEQTWKLILQWEELHEKRINFFKKTDDKICSRPSLKRFIGRPTEPTLKAKMLSFFG